jgi:hypothetical protein
VRLLARAALNESGGPHYQLAVAQHSNVVRGRRTIGCFGLSARLGFLAWNISYRLANMHRRGVCSIVDAALVSPGLNFIVRCRGGAVFQLGGEP